MISRKLRQVKREIRVLGVAAGRDAKGYTIVGIIYRGNLWLDGVLRVNSNSDDLTMPTAEMLARSSHSGQVRVILLCRHNLPPEARLDAAELYVKTGKPVILLGDGASGVWKNDGMDTPYTAEGLSRWTAEAVLRSSTCECATPEALRVASLTLSGLVRGLDT